MPAGDLSLFHPGQRVPVTLMTDSAGNVAERTTLVEIVGQNANHTEVKQVETAGAAVAQVAQLPEDYDATTAYGNSSEVGIASVRLLAAVDWLTPTTAGALAAGDPVVSDAGGTVRAYDSAGGDTADMIFGRVWTTYQREEASADAVAVARQK